MYIFMYNKRKQKNPMRRLKLMTAKKEKGFRVNMTMAQSLVDWYQVFADEMGVPRSNAMIMGLKTYMDQQVMLKMSHQVNMMETMAKIEEEKKL